MKITFDSDVLGDDLPASGSRRTIQIVGMPGQCVVQKEPLAGGANPFLKTRGNVSGQFSFIVTNTFDTQDAANDFIVAEYQRIGGQASLVWERSADDVTFANAILAACAPVEIAGVKVRQQYTFEITTVSIA